MAVMHPSARLTCSEAAFSEGQALLQLRQIEAALQCFNRAQAAGFDESECAAARWNCWMLLGHLERAWEESDRIALNGRADPYRVWNGEPWAGKRVLLRGLHGLGDTLHFVRYAALLAQSATSVAAQVHPQLATLIEGAEAIDRVYTWGRTTVEPDPSEWDVAMEVTELPRAFRSRLTTLPSTVPYIQVPAERREWARRVAGERQKFRIGLAWQTGAWNPSRSIPLKEFYPLFGMTGFHFYSLQKGADLTNLPSRFALRDIEAHATDIRDTAALVLEMDLIITADTMTAHLAGALGRPVWILLPFAADWRWMSAREGSPWYPTASLFRQERAREWTPVLEKIARRLRCSEFCR
jgi:hypothetical protein